MFQNNNISMRSTKVRKKYKPKYKNKGYYKTIAPKKGELANEQETTDEDR